jgi:hypothetical protein
MRWLLWTLFALAALIWTTLAWAFAAAFRAISGALAQGSSADLAAWVSSWSVPNWVIVFLDVQWLQALQVLLVQILDQLPHAWPWLAEPVRWMIPAVWVAWAVVLLLLLALTVALHIWVAKPPMATGSTQR